MAAGLLGMDERDLDRIAEKLLAMPRLDGTGGVATAEARGPRCARCDSTNLYALRPMREGEEVRLGREAFCWAERRVVEVRR